jgi:drug/metabolite transporter (DMT)-like permease
VKRTHLFVPRAAADLALAVAAVSLSGPLVQWGHAPPLVTGAGRTLLAFFFAIPGAVVAYRRWTPRRPPAPAQLAWAGVAAVSLALHFATWMSGLGLTTLASALVLVNAHPLLVLAGERLLWGRAIRRKEWAGSLVALAGIALMSAADHGTGGGKALLGDALAFAGAVTEAFYVLAGAYVRRAVPNAVYVAFLYAACALCLAGGAKGLGEAWPPLARPVPAWLAFLGLAVGPTTLGHSRVNRALGEIRPAVVSLALLLEPVLASLWAYLWLGESPTLWDALGGLVTLAGVAWALWPSAPWAPA